MAARPTTCTARPWPRSCTTWRPTRTWCQASPAAWSKANDGLACDDGQYCTVTDACQSGVCTAGPARDCSGVADACHAGVCSEGSDTCLPTAVDQPDAIDGSGDDAPGVDAASDAPATDAPVADDGGPARDGGGSGCSASGASSPSAWLLLASLLGLAVLARRRVR